MLSDPITTWVTATDVSFSLLLHSAGLPEFVQTTWKTCQLILNSFQLSKRTICLQNEPFCIAIAQSSWVKKHMEEPAFGLDKLPLLVSWSAICIYE